MNGILAAPAASDAAATGPAAAACGAGAEPAAGAWNAEYAEGSTGPGGAPGTPGPPGGADGEGDPEAPEAGAAGLAALAGSLAALHLRLERVAGEQWAVQVQAMREQFALSVRHLGVRHFSYQLVRCPMMHRAGPLTPPLHTFPADWRRTYAEHEFAADDPLQARALRSSTPFRWAELGATGPGGAEALGARQRLFLGELRRHGLGDGMTIPVHTHGEVAVLHVVPEPGQAARMHRHGHVLHLMAYYLHHKARRPMVELALSESARRRSLLSPRETEVLEWTARGKTTRETSNRLGVSEKAVEFHLNSAKRKLHASNRTHAVAKALVLKLLFDAA